MFAGDDRKSLWAYQAASARYGALRKPDAAVCIDAVFGPKGELVDSRTPDWVSEKLLQGLSGAENPRVNWAGDRRRSPAQHSTHGDRLARGARELNCHL